MYQVLNCSVAKYAKCVLKIKILSFEYTNQLGRYKYLVDS